MKIAVFGTGVVGQMIAEKLVELGHEVMIGTRNVQNTLARSGPDNFGRPPFSEWHKRFSNIKLGTYTEAAAFGEFIVNATNGTGTLPALEQAGKRNLANKVMLDISNPLDFSKGMPPTLFICNTDSLAEQIQRNYPETRVVKSLNTMNAFVMVNPGILPEDHHVFLSGNDDQAKARVKE
ncbi:MAG TPA: NAD(P)-binding domain-containing protein, partial [Candidatus Brocadiaceae bacterium]